MFRPTGKRWTRFVQIFIVMVGVTLLTLLLATIITYRTFEQKLVDRMHEKSLQLLGQTRSVFSSIHSTSIPYFIQLSKDPWISKLMYGTDLSIRNLLEGMESLNRAMLSRPYLYSIVVYNYREQTIFSSTKGPVPVSEFYDQELISILHNVKKHGFYRYIPRKIRRPGETRVENVFTVIVGFPPINRDQSLGALIFNISENNLREHLFSDLADSEPYITITGRDGRILSHSDPGLFGKDGNNLPYLAAASVKGDYSGVIRREVEDSSYWVSYLTDEVMGWRFVSLTHSSDFTQQLSEYRNTIIVVALLLIALVLAVDYLLSRRLSKPIERLFREARELQKAVKSGNIRFDTEGDPTPSPQTVGEIEGLRQILENTRLRMNSFAKLEVVAALHALLEGRIDITQEAKVPKELLDFFDQGSIRPVVFLVDGAFRLRARYGADYLASVRSIIESLIPEQFAQPAIAVDMGYDQLVAVFAEEKSESPDYSHENMVEEIRRFQEKVYEKLTCTISVGVGVSESEYVLVREDYQAAHSAALDRFKNGHNSVSFAQGAAPALAEKTSFYRFPPEDDLRCMVDLMMLGKKEEAIERARDIVHSVEESEYPDFVFMIQLLTYYLYRLLGSRLGHPPDLGRNFELLAKDHRWADTLRTVDEYVAEAITFFIEEQTSEQRKRRRDTVEKAQNYIENNLADVNLSSNSIADAVGLSTNYLRLIFKKHNSESLSDYIIDRRIERAKEYFAQKKCTVKEVAEQCGFTNYTYFFTLFKKKTGQTPKQYVEKNSNVSPVS